MKKFYVILFSLLSTTFAFAGGNSGNVLTQVTSDKPIVDNGFYLILGIGVPSYNAGFASQSMGIQPSIEIGNQFLFYKTDKLGIGMNISWFMFGYSSKNEDIAYGFTYKMHNVALQFLKFGPQVTVGLNDDMAVDAYLDIIPLNVNVGGGVASASSGSDNTYAMLSAFSTFAPGIKFRYKVLTIGAEVQFGNQRYADTSTDNSSDIKFDVSYINPRLLLGFKF